MADSVPVKLMLGSLLPLPVTKLSPVTVASVSVPLATLMVRRTALLLASTSATVNALPFAALNTRLLSSRTTCGDGTVSVGASLTGLITSDAVSLTAENAVVPPLTLLSASPPLVPLVWSQARKLMALTSVPL